MSETVNLAQIELLARVGLFPGLDRIALAKLVAYLEPLLIGDGLAVCHQGDPADGLYIIVRGTFGAFAVAPDGGATRLATLRAGDFFGEMGLLTNEPRTATVRAEGAGEVLRLESGRFLQLCRQDTTVALTIAA